MEDFSQNQNQTIKEQMDEFHVKKKEQFDFTYMPNSLYYRFTADEFRDKDQFDTAIEIYKLGLELDDNNMKILFNLADTYDKKGELKSAEKLFTKSLSLLEAQKDKVDANYYKNIKEWATKKLEEYKK